MKSFQVSHSDLGLCQVSYAGFKVCGCGLYVGGSRCWILKMRGKNGGNDGRRLSDYRHL